MNTFARGKKRVKKFMVNMKHARLGQENEQGVEKGNFQPVSFQQGKVLSQA